MCGNWINAAGVWHKGGDGAQHGAPLPARKFLRYLGKGSGPLGGGEGLPAPPDSRDGLKGPARSIAPNGSAGAVVSDGQLYFVDPLKGIEDKRIRTQYIQLVTDRVDVRIGELTDDQRPFAAHRRTAAGSRGAPPRLASVDTVT